MSSFESTNIGDSARLSHRITDDDVRKFIQLTGDDNRIHTDEEFSRGTPLKRPVVHGMLSASFLSTLIGTKLPGDGALWYEQNFKFLKPVRIGDELTVTATVVGKNEKRRTLELETVLTNQFEEVVITGVARVKAPAQRPPARALPRECSTALIIGANGGIGSAVARELAGLGFDLGLHYFNRKGTVEKTAAFVRSLKKNVVLGTADISDKAEVNDLVRTVEERLGHIDILINCATSPIADYDHSKIDWDTLNTYLAVDVQGTLNVVQAVIPGMKERSSGKIIVFSSLAVELPNQEWIPYITSKAALEGMARAFATALAPWNICVNIISPGLTDTELTATMSEKARLLTRARTPLARIPSPEEIASVAGFLSSGKSSFLTGETIRVNGGQIMR